MTEGAELYKVDTQSKHLSIKQKNSVPFLRSTTSDEPKKSKQAAVRNPGHPSAHPPPTTTPMSPSSGIGRHTGRLEDG